MKETNAERVISNFVMSKSYHPKSDKLRFRAEDNSIYDRGTLIGFFVEDSVDGEWLKYLILCLQDFKNDPLWKKHKQQLAKEANKWGIRVIFEEFDFGFTSTSEWYHTDNELFDKLLIVAKYSQDKDIKTAACVTNCCPREMDDDKYERIIAYSYNQQLNEDSWLHAEKAVADYCRMREEEPRRWLTLLQPCEHCLKAMVDLGATDIFFGWPHKEKWNTPGYYELADKLVMKEVRQPFSSFPVLYKYQPYKKVWKFYKKVGT